MADRSPDARPPARSQPPRFADAPRQRETATERRTKQIAVAGATQIDLKREAAERRARKNRG